METGRLWAVIQRHIDEQEYTPTDAQIARTLGISTSGMGKWKRGETLPKPEHLARIAIRLRLDYFELLFAALEDRGYEVPGGTLTEAVPSPDESEAEGRPGPGSADRGSAARPSGRPRPPVSRKPPDSGGARKR